MHDLSLDRLDADGAIAEAAERAGVVSRGTFLAGALGGSLALLGLAGERAVAQAPGPSDVAILNYALTLEYLQAAFYTEAQRMKALRGRAANAADVVGAVERAHVAAFRDVLGAQAVSRPSFDFQGTTEEQNAFLKTAVAFEDSRRRYLECRIRRRRKAADARRGIRRRPDEDGGKAEDTGGERQTQPSAHPALPRHRTHPV